MPLCTLKLQAGNPHLILCPVASQHGSGSKIWTIGYLCFCLELRAVNYLCKIPGGASHPSLGLQGRRGEGGRSLLHSLFTSRQNEAAQPQAHAVPYNASGEPLLGRAVPSAPRRWGQCPRGACCRGASAPSALAHGSQAFQAFLYLPFLPSFLLLSNFLLFTSLVKRQFINFRVTAFSLSQPSFISEPLPSFFLPDIKYL